MYKFINSDRSFGMTRKAAYYYKILYTNVIEQKGKKYWYLININKVHFSLAFFIKDEY